MKLLIEINLGVSKGEVTVSIPNNLVEYVWTKPSKNTPITLNLTNKL